MDKNINKSAKVIRWIARIFGTFLAVYLTFSTIANLIMDYKNWDFIPYTYFAFFIILTIGVIIAWFKEKIGGIILIAGAVVGSIFSIIVGLDNPDFDLLDFIILAALPFIIVGILFLIYWFKSRKQGVL
jgi:hypothetical protein